MLEPNHRRLLPARNSSTLGATGSPKPANHLNLFEALSVSAIRPRDSSQGRELRPTTTMGAISATDLAARLLCEGDCRCERFEVLPQVDERPRVTVQPAVLVGDGPPLADRTGFTVRSE